MKKRLLAVVLLFLLILAPLALLSCRASRKETLLPAEPLSFTALVLGTDDAAQNTDVILLLRYHTADNTISLMQIPRDTYLKNDFGTPKINHIYPALLAEGKSGKDALSEVADILSDVFAVSIDAALALRPEALSRLVDEIGGVPIELPMDMTYDDPASGTSIRLQAGKQTLDGEAAVQFVRYRSGYLEGDLGRVDAQKLFLAAFFEKARQSIDISHALSLLVRPPKGITLVADKMQLMSVAKRFYQNKDAVRAVYFSLPGEAVRPESAGAWYYAINRNSAVQLLKEYFSLSESEDFDAARRFLGPSLHFENIYFANGYPYRVFTHDEIQDIIIKKKE